MLKDQNTIFTKPLSEKENGLLVTAYQHTEFENLYYSVRKKEGWIYTADQLQKLPDVEIIDPLYSFWQSRKRSSQKLLHYLQSKSNLHTILDIGCGNGWLTHMLATNLHNTDFLGVDIFENELQSAASAFSAPNLTWVLGDVMQNIFQQQSVNTILFCASAQYFKDFPLLINQLLRYLQRDGEIHIMDTPFYRAQQYNDAKNRTEKYYHAMGVPEMCDHYFHRQYDELSSFHYTLKYKPGPINKLQRLFTTIPPMEFPWIIIRH